VDKKILEKILSGLSDKNIRFQDLRKLLANLGFSARIKGDHHIFFKEGVEEIINLQPLKDGKAKAYQVKQVRTIILKYKFHEGLNDV
jgi:predicted RNA binding protein YcfA (HicA-like mRNA interferase family)